MNIDSGPHSSSPERRVVQMPAVHPDRKQTMPAISPEQIRRAVEKSDKEAMDTFLRDTNAPEEMSPGRPEHHAQEHIPAISQEDIQQAMEREEAKKREADKGGALARAKANVMKFFGK